MAIIRIMIIIPKLTPSPAANEEVWLFWLFRLLLFLSPSVSSEGLGGGIGSWGITSFIV